LNEKTYVHTILTFFKLYYYINVHMLRLYVYNDTYHLLLDCIVNVITARNYNFAPHILLELYILLNTNDIYIIWYEILQK